MSGTDLKERESKGVYDSPGWYGNDPLEEQFQAPSVTDKDLPDNHPSKNETTRGESGSQNKQSSDTDQPNGGRSQSIKAKYRKKKYAVYGSIGGGTIGVLIALFSIITGPLEFLQLDFALGRFNRSSSLLVTHRINHGYTKMARAFSTGDVGETRVSIIGSRVFNNLIDRLDRQHGITFERRDSSGRPRAINIVPQEGSPLRGSTDAETRSNISRFLGVSPDRIGVAAGTYTVSVEGLGQGPLRRIIGSLIVLDNIANKKATGPVVVSMRYRNMAKFWNAFSLFRPMNRLASSAQEGVDTRAQRVLERDRRNRTGRTAELPNRYLDARNRLIDRMGARNLARAGSLLTFTGELCFLAEIAGIIPDLNYLLIVQPAMMEAIDKQAVASQVMSGDNFTVEELAAIQGTFSDRDGRTIWQAKSLNALSNGGVGSGEPADAALRNAMGMRGSSLEVLSETLFEDIPELQALASAGDDFAGVACSSAGYTFQIAAGGLLTVFVPGAAFAKGAQLAGSVAVHALIANWLSGVIEDEVTTAAGNACGAIDLGEDEGFEIVDATKFGNCLAYGARASNNTVAYSMGGVDMTDQQERTVLNELRETEKKEFQQLPFYARLLSPDHPRSLLAQVGIKLSQNKTLANVTGHLGNNLARLPQLLLSSFVSILNPQGAEASAVGYDWNFPLAGVPFEIMNDPKFEDPIENAIIFEQLYNSESVDTSRAKTCFGVEFRRINGVLQAIAEHEVVPNSDEFMGGNCSSLDSDTWIRTVLFVFDDSIAAAIDCYDGGAESCAQIGMQQTAQTADTSSPFPHGLPPPVSENQFTWPLPEEHDITACWNDDRTGFSEGYFHSGLDMRASNGTDIVSSADGTVVVVRSSSSGTGNTLIIEHEGGFYTQYQHLEGYNVSEGDRVTQGQVVATANNTGFSTAPHLHFNIQRDGQILTRGQDTLNPLDYLPADDRNKRVTRGSMAPPELRGKTVECVPSSVNINGWVVVD